MKLIEPGIGHGMYSLSSAAHLLSIRKERLKRWAHGYREVKPVILSSKQGAITFYELIELHIVKAFVDKGVPLKKVRLAHSLMRKRLGTPYPFANHRLVVSGRELIDEKDGMFETVPEAQSVFAYAQKFFVTLEFEGDLAASWRPYKKTPSVVIDRRRKFGLPYIDRHGISTDVLFSIYVAEGGDESAIKSVADWYEIPVKSVREAVTYEKHLLAA